jgi:chemotaxis protein methyltransferase WspC
MIQDSEIRKLLAETIGLDTDSLGKRIINHAVSSHMTETGVRDFAGYIDLLRNAPEVLEELIEKVVVTETWFFRDTEPFLYLSEYVRDVQRQAVQVGPLRILSVPCSTGEEPYSIAMTLLEAGLAPGEFLIDAVDISSRALKKACDARFGAGSFREKNIHIAEGYSVKSGKEFLLDSGVVSQVNFSRENIMSEDFTGRREPYQIIFCRNLLVYLTPVARIKILSHLERLLVPGGILFTGAAELMFFYQRGYLPVEHPQSFACRKTEQVQSKVAVLPEKPFLKASSHVHHRASRKQGKEAPARGRPDKPAGMTAPIALEMIRDMADRGALEQACSLCESFLKEHGTCAEAYYLMGVICQASNSSDRAEDFFLKSIFLDPQHYEALIHLHLIHAHRGDAAKAALFKERAERLRNSPRPGKDLTWNTA